MYDLISKFEGDLNLIHSLYDPKSFEHITFEKFEAVSLKLLKKYSPYQL